MDKSLIRVLRNLDAEGFTPYTAHSCVKWFRRAVFPDKLTEIRKNKKKMSKFMADKTREDKNTVGKFLGNLQEASFEAGLKAGLAAGAIINIEEKGKLEDE